MWRQREQYKKAAKIATALRTRRPSREHRTVPLDKRNDLARAMLAAFEQTSTLMSRAGLLRYLRLVAERRPRTFLYLLCRCLDYKLAKYSPDKQALGTILEKLLCEALKGWRDPRGSAPSRFQ